LLKSNLSSNENAWERLYEWFEQTGIERSRLELTDGVKSMAEHLACYGRVDIALDTHPYNGTTTTCEALWMGVPVVTLAGQTHASRVGVSLLSQVGLEAFIATTPADYVDIASRLAADPDQLLRLRAELRHRMAASSLCNGIEHARQVEQAYRALWHKWCATYGK
jgi:predicted O-linked N-acetylglucosamine transferase (SPINDLY family)